MQGHGLRATFASIAEELVSPGSLKRMLNHAAAGDVTLGHYVAKSEAQLRAGWQAVADFIEGAAAKNRPADACTGSACQPGWATQRHLASIRSASVGAVPKSGPAGESSGSQHILERV